VNPKRRTQGAETLTPREIVAELDQYIIGQRAAKRAVAVALRNRWRRRQLPEYLRDEVVPKNILMIGPTGVGKTEIARRLAKLANAPFLKVEASKFTEVGYVGRDVESIVRDLADESMRLIRQDAIRGVQDESRRAAIERVAGLLEPQIPAGTSAYTELLQRIERGECDDKEIDIDIEVEPDLPFGIAGMGPGSQEMERSLKDMLGQMMPNRRKSTRMRVGEALHTLGREEAARRLDEDAIRRDAVRLVENHGVVFLDEIDKVARDSGRGGGPDVSGEGVQRDLLPIVEGSTVETKIGPIKTDHVLFVAAGAFHVAKPSDMIPELQGRFPIRVELEALGESELLRILTEPKASLIKQAEALLSTEGVDVRFEPEALESIATAAADFNRELDNIGARRLHTIVERVLEELSFNAPDLQGQKIPITPAYVHERLAAIHQHQELARYIL